MNIISVFVSLLLLSAINTAIYIILDKWGVVAWLQYRVNKYFVPAHCQFCFFHRLALIELLFRYLMAENWHDWPQALIFYPLACAVFSLALLRR